MAVGLAALGALALWWPAADGTRAGATPGAPAPASAKTARPAQPADPHAGHDHGEERLARPPAEAPAREPEPGLDSTPTRPDPRDFAGRATLRGRVEVFGDEGPPERWTLSLRPSTTLFGREHAEPRELVFPGSRLEFTVEDLPLGGYDVQAVAPGRNGRALPILLTRRNSSPYVVLELTPASTLEGALVDGAGAPVEGLAVSLVAPDGSLGHATISDALGRYRFEGVRDGAWRLVLGEVDSPLVPPRPLRLAHPGMSFPTIELGELATLEVWVLDEAGLFLGGAPVRGSGSRGGLLEGATDPDGRVVFPHLSAGRYRLRAEHPLDPERTSERTAVELAPGTTERVELRFRR